VLTSILWNRAFNRQRKRKYFETTTAATHTNALTAWLISTKIQCSGVTECMGFHLIKFFLVAPIFNDHQETGFFAIFHCLWLGEWLILAHNTTCRSLTCIVKVTSFINPLRWLKFRQEKSTSILKISEFQIEQEKSHKHTHTRTNTQSADILFDNEWTSF
jgi:hypothetical protein